MLASTALPARSSGGTVRTLAFAAAGAGAIRETLLRKARQTETASHINAWLNSPGLQAPK